MNTRRNFLKNIGLATAGVTMHTQQREVISCAPMRVLAGTIASVKSGNWSDPSVWGGSVPKVSDTPLISAGHSITLDVSTGIAGINIAGVLMFDSAKTLLVTSTKNIVVAGKLQMRPIDIVTHTITFTGINENNFVGGGMDVLESDIGLWVMDGVLDIVGQEKTSWTRATGEINAGATTVSLEDVSGWKIGDNISIVPTAYNSVVFDDRVINSISGNSVSIAATTAHPRVNNKWTAEVMNLTRNVIIQGTTTGRSHIFLRSNQAQNIQYALIQLMGPRKDRGGTSAKELISGRYGLHFHHGEEGSRGTIVKGCVIKDTNSHGYVPHVSHGVTIKDCIAYNTIETAFWWDPTDATHDCLYDHNIAALCGFVQGSLNMNAEDAPTFSSSGFAMNTGDGNTAINNVAVVAGMNDPADGGGFNWEAVLQNEGVWVFQDNLSHNNTCGLRVWQNSTRNHVIENFTSYYNAVGLFHGAYANSYTYNGGEYYGCGMQLKAASVNTCRLRIENITIDAAGLVDYCIESIESPLEGVEPAMFRNLILKNGKKGAINDTVDPQFIHSIDAVNCSITGNAVVTAPSNDTIRVQPVSGQPYKITKSGKTNIAAFAPTVWGTGKGLKAEYYNGTNFDSLAFTRIDSNVSFEEWANGLHHLITSLKYSVRWTGKVMFQYKEQYRIHVATGGGCRLWVNNVLMINQWSDGYPATYSTAGFGVDAGQVYDIRLEYFNTDEKTGAGLFWSSVRQAAQYIPQSQLYAEAPVVTPPTNQPPVVNAGADQIITGTTATLSGSATDDGTVVKYQWTGAKGMIVSPNEKNTVITGLTAGVYSFLLTATDDKGLTSSAPVNVTVQTADTLTISVSPNPFKSNTTLVIKASKNAMCTVTVYRSSGSILQSFQTMPGSITGGEDWSKGTYVVKVVQGGLSQSIKIQKD